MIHLTEAGKIIRKIRIDLCEKQMEMAYKLGVTDSYLSSIERGERVMTFDVLQKLVKAYGIKYAKGYDIIRKVLSGTEWYRIPVSDANIDKLAEIIYRECERDGE